MTAPPTLNEWLADFAAHHDLPTVLAATPDLIEQQARVAATYAAEHIPARYASAFPASPDVQGWIASVILASAERTVELGRQVVTIHRGPSLLLLGATGVGKTYEAYGAMRVIAGMGVHSRWVVITAADMYARLRPRHGVDSEAEFEAIAGAPLLTLDDLGAAKNSEWTEDVNTRLINHRYNEMLPTLFTSNLGAKELTEALGERVVSRLAEMTKRVALKGSDRRRSQ